MQAKKNSLIVVLLLALAAFLTVGSTLAYLTDVETESLSYTVGKVNVNVDEPTWRQANTSYMEDFVDTDGKVKRRALLYPSRKIEKDPVVLIGEGSEDCYVRLKVSIDDNLYKVLQWPPEPNINWERTRIGDTNTYYYTYQKRLTKEDIATNPAFDYVEVMAEIELPTGVSHEEYLEKANGEAIDIQAEAIQAEGFKGVKEAFAAFDQYAVR